MRIFVKWILLFRCLGTIGTKLPFFGTSHFLNWLGYSSWSPSTGPTRGHSAPRSNLTWLICVSASPGLDTLIKSAPICLLSVIYLWMINSATIRTNQTAWIILFASVAKSITRRVLLNEWFSLWYYHRCLTCQTNQWNVDEFQVQIISIIRLL